MAPPAWTLLALLAAPRTFDHVVVISVDGLRSDALLVEGRAGMPGFARMIDGAATLNARTDPDSTVTLPNHASMMTGRPVLGDAGHGWILNDDAPAGQTLHATRGAYVAGVFDVAHDRGLRTALFAGKSKFSLYDTSWDDSNGAPDEVGEDEGRDKIDEYGVFSTSAEIADAVIRTLEESDRRSLVFAHFAETDLVAHLAGWDVSAGSGYMRAVQTVDREIARILDAVEAESSLRGRTAVLVTSDHGGGAPLYSHDKPRMWVDYIIPFLVWTGDEEKPRELYAINPDTRRDPGLQQPPTDAPGPPPIRNGDAGNLALALLGLPPVPGSTINAEQDLAVFGVQ